ncbi:MAG: polymer-forming cytoskeletal protein [Acidobacteriota bacterium]
MGNFFSRGPEPASTPRQPARPEPTPAPTQARSQPAREPVASGRTHIARGTKFEGLVTGNAELLVDGEIEGDIRLDAKVVVGEQGVVRGRIYAASVEVGGRVEGDVRGRERVQVLSSGRLEGDVTSPPESVVIAEGAFFKGKVEMTDNVEPVAASAPAKPASSDDGDAAEAKTADATPQATASRAERPAGSGRDKRRGRRGGAALATAESKS